LAAKFKLARLKLGSLEAGHKRAKFQDEEDEEEEWPVGRTSRLCVLLILFLFAFGWPLARL